MAYQAGGRLPEAIALFKQVRDARLKNLGADHPHTLIALNNLAEAYHAAGKLPEAIELHQQVRNVRVKKQGPDHPDTLTTLHNLAAAYYAVGQMPNAIELFEQVRDAQVKKLGTGHFETLNTLHNLAVAYRATGELPKAIELFEQVRDAQVKKLGSDHPSTLTTLNNLGGKRIMPSGSCRKAIERAFERVRDALSAKKLGADHPNTLGTLNNLAMAYRATGKLPEAITLYQQVRDACVKKLGSDHPNTLLTLHNLAGAYQAAGKLPEALPLFEQAADGVRKRRFLHQIAGVIIANTIAAYEAAKAWDKAETWRRAWMAHVKDKAGAESPAYAAELAALGFNLLRQHRWTDAESVLGESLKLRQKLAPEAWTTFNTISLLGGALAGQNKHAEAEPLLLKGFQGMKARVKSIPPQGKVHLSESAQRLVELYRAMKRDDEARKWQQTLTDIVGRLQEPIHDVGKGLTLKNQLDARALTLTYQVRLQAGMQYVIVMTSADGMALAPSVVLTDEENNVLAESRPSGGDARISYRVPRTAVYRIRATSANDGQGAFTLTVGEKREERGR